MINSKRSSFAVAALLTITFFSVGLVHGQTNWFKLDIPFAFYMGDTLLPAGTYQLENLTGNAMTIYAVKGRQSVTLPTFAVDTAQKPGSKLIFNRYGKDYFLTEMWGIDHAQGRKLLPSAVERELAQKITPTRLTLAGK